MKVIDSEAQEQIERLVQSDLFRLSEQQRRLLAYLAEKALTGEAEQLKEYTIAIDALGRPESYDPRRDSAVRLQLSKLRQKLREYYATVGTADPVVVDFPKGQFKLVFTRREPDREPAPAAQVPRPSWSPWFGLTLLLSVVCVFLGILAFRSQQRAPVQAVSAALSPALKEFWSPFLGDRTPALVCIGVPMFVRLSESGFFRDSEVNTWDTPGAQGLKEKLQTSFPGENLEPWFFYTGTGEAAGAFLIGNLLAGAGNRATFVNSSRVTWSEIGEHNVVFLGPPKFIRQLDELPVSCDLILESTGIRNTKPHKGEPEFLRDEYLDSRHSGSQSYGLISRLPGLHGKGEILVIGGTWTDGTMAASQYVTLETHARELISRMRLPSGKLPRYFQVVISTIVKNGTPVETKYVFHHILDNSANPE